MKRINLSLLSLSLVVGCFGDKVVDDTEATADTQVTDTSDSGEEDAYAFATEAPGDYTRVDRMGMPAVSTALIVSKDHYNASDPTDDLALTFAVELIGSLAGLHGSLDDDLVALGLTPCTVVGDGTGTCITQAAPLVIPDTLKLDTTGTAGFPNGRKPADPVMDVTLAVLLLDLSAHSADTLVGALNPAANDVAFDASFPYLAAAH